MATLKEFLSAERSARKAKQWFVWCDYVGELHVQCKSHNTYCQILKLDCGPNIASGHQFDGKAKEWSAFLTQHAGGAQ